MSARTKGRAVATYEDEDEDVDDMELVRNSAEFFIQLSLQLRSSRPFVHFGRGCSARSFWTCLAGR